MTGVIESSRLRSFHVAMESQRQRTAIWEQTLDATPSCHLEYGDDKWSCGYPGIEKRDNYMFSSARNGRELCQDGGDEILVPHAFKYTAMPNCGV